MADKETTVRRGYQAFSEGDMEHFRGDLHAGCRAAHAGQQPDVR